MSKAIKIFLILTVLGLGMIILTQSSAQEVPAEVTKEVNLDEDVQPGDLGVGEPMLLPGHPLYFLKNWGRSIRLFFAFRPVTKAELREKFANEKLIELKKLIAEKKNPDDIKKGIENYQDEIEKIKDQADKIKDKAKDNPRVESFLDKFLHQQILHEKLLSKLENQVPPEAFEKIKKARERHLERFKDVMLKLEDRKEKIAEKLDETLEKQKGSKYKNFKNLEILLELEEKVPEQAKEAIRRAQENSLKRLKGDLEKMSPEDQERFKEYIEKIGGVKERKLEILENLKSELKEKPEIQKKIIQSRDKVLERIKQKGAEKPKFCITLWNPVCGKDGKTYSNECFAKVAGVKIAHKGVCKVSTTSSNILYKTEWDSGRLRTTLLRSDDGGKTWKAIRTQYKGGIVYATDSKNPNLIYAGDAGGNLMAENLDIDLVKSTDGGEHWTDISKGILDRLETDQLGGVASIRIDPNNSNIVMVNVHPRPASREVVSFKSIDGGNTWIRL